MFPEITRDDVFRLETRRLWLRWPRAADASGIAQAAGHKDLAAMTARIPHPYPRGAAESFVLAARQGNATGASLDLVASLSRGNRDLVGAVGVRPAAPGTLEIGYWIAPRRWGQGFATEAVLSLVDGVFAVTEFDAIEACVRSGNPASERVLQKAGFSWVGSQMREFPERGASFPTEQYRLDRSAWRGLESWSEDTPARPGPGPAHVSEAGAWAL